MKPYLIYKVTNLINGKVYIGYTKKNLETRFSEHFYAANNRDSNYWLHAAIRKYGQDNFKIEELFIFFDQSLAFELEKHFIGEYDSFQNGYNMNEGGTGLKYHTDESKLKMSEMTRGDKHWNFGNLGELNPMYGRNHSDEVKKKIGEQAKQRYENGMMHPMKGRKHSEETKEKIRLKAIGRPSAKKGRKFPRRRETEDIKLIIQT